MHHVGATERVRRWSVDTFMSAMRSTALCECIQMSYATHQFSARSHGATAPDPGGDDHDGTGFKIHPVRVVRVQSRVDLNDRRRRKGIFYKFINF